MDTSSSTSLSGQSKHDSGDFSGTVFLISSGGEILKLPIPSPSLRDPLNWSRKRRAAAGACLWAFSAVSMYAIQVTRIEHAKIGLDADFDYGDRCICLDPFVVGAGTTTCLPPWNLDSDCGDDGGSVRTERLHSSGRPVLCRSCRWGYLELGTAFITALSLFFLPESFFIRPAVAYDGRILVQSSTEKVKLYEPWQYAEGEEDDLEQASLEVRHKQISPWMSWMRMLRPFGASWKSMLACYPQILLCVCNPLIFWVAVMNAINFGGMLFVGSTISGVLARPPYSLSDQLLGLVNGSAAVGALIAWPLTVSLGCPIVKKLTVRADGVRHAENYLIFYLLPILTGVASVVLYGLTVTHEWHFSIACLAYGLNSFSNIGMGLANTLWVTEAFPRWAAAALVVVGGVSYMASFAISFAVPPWVETEGFAKTGIEMGVLLLVAGLVALPVTLWGKSLRQAIHGKWSLYEGGALRPHGKRKEEKREDEEVEW
ncbi:hypothetical protein DL769_000485 [Monosporascus sp. CRB-8-3]|nr:hypothetical protein DL769_000485 [Monosporascus sp. CRB-8-3]